MAKQIMLMLVVLVAAACLAPIALFGQAAAHPASSTGIAMNIAQQMEAPARLVETMHTVQDLLAGAQLQNRSRKTITAYRVGWLIQYPDRTENKQGVLMNVPAGIQPGRTYAVLGQAVNVTDIAPTHPNAVVFYISAVTFADGSNWKADVDKLKNMSRQPEPK